MYLRAGPLRHYMEWAYRFGWQYHLAVRSQGSKISRECMRYQHSSQLWKSDILAKQGCLENQGNGKPHKRDTVLPTHLMGVWTSFNLIWRGKCEYIGILSIYKFILSYNVKIWLSPSLSLCSNYLLLHNEVSQNTVSSNNHSLGSWFQWVRNSGRALQGWFIFALQCLLPQLEGFKGWWWFIKQRLESSDLLTLTCLVVDIGCWLGLQPGCLHVTSLCSLGFFTIQWLISKDESLKRKSQAEAVPPILC